MANVDLFVMFISNSNGGTNIYVFLVIPTAGLGWHRRYEIIIGICRALHYLHMECQIAHMDLKTQNILLDENLQPKIAYFGMFHLFDWPLSKHIKENGEATV